MSAVRRPNQTTWIGATLLIGALVLSGCSPSPSAEPTPSDSASAAPNSPTVPGSPTPTARPRASASPAEDDVDCAKVKCIALTYDDGPSPETPRLLDALAKRKAKATFFLVGPNATQYAKTVRREQHLGMEIGNHTTDHLALTSLSDAKVARELRDTQERIHAVTGDYPTVMRPPYGARSASVDKIAGAQGLAVVTWDTSPVDWENHTADKIVQIAVAQAQPNQIVLMHDIHPWTVQAAPRILDQLGKLGYHFVTVSHLLGRPKPGKLYPTN